jgi:hypothetical protein
MKRSPIFISWLEIGVVVSADAMGAEVLPRKIQQLATDLNRSQVEEVPDISNFCLG